VPQRRSYRPLRPIIDGPVAAAGGASCARSFADPVSGRNARYRRKRRPVQERALEFGATLSAGRAGPGLSRQSTPRDAEGKLSDCSTDLHRPFRNTADPRSERRQGPISRACPHRPRGARRSAAVAGGSAPDDDMIANTLFVAVTGGIIAFLALCTLIGFVLARRVSFPWRAIRW
jgi:hypothetical protein